jgi:ABC-2 type transport system ATP-binding protein
VGLYEGLTAYDNLDFYGKIYRCTEQRRKENIEYFLKMLGLWEKRDAPAGTFSKGMKQKLAIARALVHDPEVIFMDEPTANLDPESAKTVRDFLLELKRENRTIFLNTHNLDEAQRICDRIGILNTKLVAIGTPEELERSVGGRKTVVQVRRVTDEILKALKELPIGEMVRDDKRLAIEVADPENENPGIVRAIVRAGGDVQSVSVVGSTLEETYLNLVREKK